MKVQRFLFLVDNISTWCGKAFAWLIILLTAAVGAAGAFLLASQAQALKFQRVKESVILTAKAAAMVCWLFVGSALSRGLRDPRRAAIGRTMGAFAQPDAGAVPS